MRQQFFFHKQLQQLLVAKYYPIWCKFWVFISLLIVRTELKENKHSKVATVFYLRVPELAILTKLNREKPEIITSSPSEKITAGSRKEN